MFAPQGVSGDRGRAPMARQADDAGDCMRDCACCASHVCTAVQPLAPTEQSPGARPMVFCTTVHVLRRMFPRRLLRVFSLCVLPKGVRAPWGNADGASSWESLTVSSKCALKCIPVVRKFLLGRERSGIMSWLAIIFCAAEHVLLRISEQEFSH